MLLHICPVGDWDGRAATYVPPRYEMDGFIHLSTREQVVRPAQRLFAGRDDLLLLVIDEELVDAEIRWEPSAVPGEEGELFPHLYAPLPVASVTDVVAFPPGEHGEFRVPDAVPPGSQR